MDEAELFNKTNGLTVESFQEALDEHQDLFDNIWNGDDSDVLLDVGSGPGNVTAEVILPKVPDNVKIIGADISNEMIKFANENYGRKGKLEFQHFDLESETLSSNLAENSFNFVTSSFLFHWIQNQRQALSNIHKLLKPNGKSLIVFFKTTVIFDALAHLSKMKKYSQYMEGIEKAFLQHYEEDSLDVFRKNATEVGFKVLHLEMKKKIYVYKNIQSFQELVKSINVFMSKAPEKLQDDFSVDILEKMDDFNLVRRNENTGNDEVYQTYRLIIAVLEK